MATIGFVGLSLYLFVKRSPGEATQLMKHANNFVKYMPIDRTSASLIGPAIEMMSNRHENMQLMRGAGMDMSGMAKFGMLEPQTKRMLRSGGSARSRSVSESKKKFVASRQHWKCADCQQPLPGSYEVDHIVDLQYGGSNHVDNLRAMCRNCHGEKNMRAMA